MLSELTQRFLITLSRFQNKRKDFAESGVAKAPVALKLGTRGCEHALCCKHSVLSIHREESDASGQAVTAAVGI